MFAFLLQASVRTLSAFIYNHVFLVFILSFFQHLIVAYTYDGIKRLLPGKGLHSACRYIVVVCFMRQRAGEEKLFSLVRA